MLRKPGITALQRGNRAYKKALYFEAAANYRESIAKSPHIGKFLEANIKIVERKIRSLYLGKTDFEDNQKIIVYTCNFGGYEPIKEPLYVDQNVEYILFTDSKSVAARYWKVIVLDDIPDDSRRASRLPKILAHKYLPRHDISVYVDSSLEIKVADIRGMVQDCLEGKDIALYKHYKRDCVYDEIDFVMNDSDRKVFNRELCELQIEKYRSVGYPAGNGLYENALIVRRNKRSICELNELWWTEYQEGVERDQFVFMYALYMRGIEVNSIRNGKEFRENPYVNFYKHKYLPSLGCHSGEDEQHSVGPTAIGKCAPRINWIVGGEDNAGWAYENNAKRFIEEQVKFNHAIQSDGESDVAVYFDVLLHERMATSSKQKVVRIGGPRPLNRLCGGDDSKLREALSSFYAVICLNQELFRKVEKVHPNIHLIPNGLDLNAFSPRKLEPKSKGQFTAGFAGSVKSSTERSVKGLDYLIEACGLIETKLLSVGRGKGQVQVPHDRMIQEFYSKIDVLVHPVGPGREGSSNVIMEALALGIPVITTEFAGYHSEKLTDRENVLFCKRSARHIAERIRDLRESSKLREQLSLGGVEFVRQHHDIRTVSKEYENIITQCYQYETSSLKISFNPFWYPVNNFATGRVRSVYPARLLNDDERIGAKIGYDKNADTVVISQLADDHLLRSIKENRKQFVIYDLCDRYYDDDRVVGGVHARNRFYQIVSRANLIVVSTITLKKELYERGINKPVVHVPDGIDFQDHLESRSSVVRDVSRLTVGWFGNPGRGNLDSSVWLLEKSLELGHDIKLITKKKSVRSYAKLYPFSVEWMHSSFLSELAGCDVVVVSHAKEEQNKSHNRLLLAAKHGVPVIACNSQSCEQILRDVGLSWAIVKDAEQFDSALTMLRNGDIRKEYFERLIPYIDRRFGDEAIRERYLKLLRDYTYPTSGRKMNVLFVSHNLNVGEGAPTSLMQAVVGLNDAGHVNPVVFSPKPGDLEAKYQERGIPVVADDFGVKSRLASKVMARAHSDIEATFTDLLKRYDIDAVVLNTATTLWLAVSARELGVPAISVIRESSDEHVNFYFGPDELMKRCREGLAQSKRVVFVSNHTKKLWSDNHLINNSVVIPNGIDLSAFADVRVLAKARVRAELDLPSEKLILLSVGSINARKSQRDIVEAFSSLPEYLRFRCHLVLVGAKPSQYLDELNLRVHELGENVSSNISIVPETRDIARWYRSADIFIFASRNESYPRVLVEAMSFGLPVVSSAVFGSKEQVVEGRNGFLFEPGDTMSMETGLSKLIEDDVLRLEFSQESEKRSWELVGYWEMVQMYRTQLGTLETF